MCARVVLALLLVMVEVHAGGVFHVTFNNHDSCGQAECPASSIVPLPDRGVDGDQPFITQARITAVPKDPCWSIEPLGIGPDTVASQLPEGVTLECYYFEVPARWRYRDVTRTVRVAAAVGRDRRETSHSEQGTMFLHGGPGSYATAGIGNYTLLTHFYDELKGVGDFILIDERGAGWSAPEAYTFYDVTTRPEAAQCLTSVTDIPTPLTAQQRQQWADCNRAMQLDLESVGVYVSDYMQQDSVRDIKAIKDYFGYSKFFLVGNSYGTFISQHFARAFPDDIDGQILDGVTSVTLSTFTGHQNDVVTNARKFNLLDSACPLEDTCSNIWSPDGLPPNGFLALLKELKEHQPESEADQEFWGGLLETVTQAAGTTADNVPYLPLVLKRMQEFMDGTISEAGRTQLVTFLGPQSGGRPPAVGPFANPTSDTIDLQWTAVLCGLFNGQSKVDVTELVGTGIFCEGIELDRIEPYDPAVYSDPVPTLIISGIWDGQTNPTEVNEIIRGYSNAHSMLLIGAGHCSWHGGGYFEGEVRNRCVESVSRDFFKNPEGVENISDGCLSLAEPVKFRDDIP